MALTNIELYEALKKDVSEEAARMIAEAVPKASELATKADIARLEHVTKADIAAVKDDIARLERTIHATEDRLKSYIDSRLLRFTAMILVPVVVSTLGTVAALLTLVVKL